MVEARAIGILVVPGVIFLNNISASEPYFIGLGKPPTINIGVDVDSRIVLVDQADASIWLLYREQFEKLSKPEAVYVLHYFQAYEPQ